MDDIGVLLAAILERSSGEGATPFQFDSAAMASILEHHWPNNVRELAQYLDVARALAADGRIVTVPVAIAERAGKDNGGMNAAPSTVELSGDDALRRAELVQYLTEHSGNVTRAAEAMGKARTQVQRWLKRLGIDPRGYRD